MQPRLEYGKAAPGAVMAMRCLEVYVRDCGLEHSLLELVRLRASQINGCAYCVDMHTKDARAMGETEQRLYAVVVWEETPFFTERERAALAWTVAVIAINGWNRLAISFRAVPGAYQPAAPKKVSVETAGSPTQ